MSVQAPHARAKVNRYEDSDARQQAKILLLMNTKPDTTLPVFTGVPDSLLGLTLSMYLEGLEADTTPAAHASALYSDTVSAVRYLLIAVHIGLQT